LRRSGLPYVDPFEYFEDDSNLALYGMLSREQLQAARQSGIRFDTLSPAVHAWLSNHIYFGPDGVAVSEDNPRMGELADELPSGIPPDGILRIFDTPGNTTFYSVERVGDEERATTHCLSQRDVESAFLFLDAGHKDESFVQTRYRRIRMPASGKLSIRLDYSPTCTENLTCTEITFPESPILAYNNLPTDFREEIQGQLQYFADLVRRYNELDKKKTPPP